MEYKHINLNIENKSLEEKFKITCDKLTNLQIKIDNETKLKFYGLFKVATVGKYDPNTNKAGFFDFSAKYKNQAWEKCSNLTKEQAMMDYIGLYHKVSGEPLEADDLKDFQNLNLDDDLDFNFDIPAEYENSSFFSTNAKIQMDEINEYKKNLNEEQKIFENLKERFYGGDIITQLFLRDVESKNNLKLESLKDSTGQGLLHCSVDAMNNSAVESLKELGVAQAQINLQDDFGMTPMHIASINFDLGIFYMLGELNPDKDIKDKESKTYLDYLKENEDIDPKILESLIN